MPIAFADKIRQVPGVVDLAPRAYFTGVFRPPYDIAAIATEPAAFFRLRPGLTVKPEYIEAMRTTRAGMLATPELLRYYGLRIGDKITLRSRETRLDGSTDWTFDIVGSLDARNPAVFAVINYAYLDEARVANRGTVEASTCASPIRGNPSRRRPRSTVCSRIRRTRRAHAPTRSAPKPPRNRWATSRSSRMQSWAVLFALLFLTGNSMRQSIHERLSEFAVLKAVGFSDAKVFGVALAEALTLYVAGALIGLALATAIAPFARDLAPTIGVSPNGFIQVSTDVQLRAAALAALFAVASIALPSLRLYRLSVAGALAR